MKINKLWKFIFFLLLGTAFFVAGFYFGKGEKIIVDPSARIDFSLFGEVYYLLEENFPNFADIDEKKLEYGIIRGLLSALGDPHTSFFDPEKSKVFLEDVSGEFEGIGVEIGIRDNNLQVISPIKNTPAYRAGMRSGDVIVSIDGESTKGITLDEAVVKIRGPKGEEVSLEIFRNGEYKEITIIRETIKIPSIEWELLHDNIAHIKLFHFHENVVQDFSVISREILNSPAESIILDLRNNPGGVLGAAISISSKFIESGEVVVLETGSKDMDDANPIRALGTSPVFLEYPIVIIINEGTASAAEILAGALRDQREIQIVGQNSFGKGSIQRMHTLDDGSVIKITEKYFLTPNGIVIEEEGLVPDLEIEITLEEIEAGEDPQLEAAIELIKKK
jgi:carboxyl-terminal processing protease